MTIRYTDIDPTISGTHDFVIRKRSPTMSHIALVFLALLLIAVAVSIGVDNKPLFIVFMYLVFGVVGWFVLVQTQKNRDLLLATEFQNALFASALGLNNKFCLIIRRDGNIVYLDRSFQDMFPDFIRQSRRSIDVLLELGAVSREESNKIYSAIERGVYEKVVFHIRGKSNAMHHIIMSIEPILRPSGFILLRGREFIENRTASEDFKDSSPLLSKSTITLFSYVMDKMNMGVYMTGPDGMIIYVNPVIEQWLEYKENEIASLNLTLQDIVSNDSKRTDKIDPGDFEGEVMLLKKSGGQMKAFVNQKVIYDDNKKLIGCTALVHSLTEETSSHKKKLW
ncbi:MAG: PAS domain-containing protein [Rickettsiales bacterium]|nr:PAS domain-containing protein [Rickettsiales bacterium]